MISLLIPSWTTPTLAVFMYDSGHFEVYPCDSFLVHSKMIVSFSFLADNYLLYF